MNTYMKLLPLPDEWQDLVQHTTKSLDVQQPAFSNNLLLRPASADLIDSADNFQHSVCSLVWGNVTSN